MTKCTDLYDHLENSEKENMKIELKSFELLRNKEGKKKIGYAIVALSNRYGGKLIIGIKDDGTFQGKNIFDIDADKGIIENICHLKISPIIEYSIEFLECEKGNILIVNVPMRKGIPHAFVVSREGPEIKNRIYYIRTSHGKRLVSDSQLQWLFKHQEDPDFSYHFRIVINYIKDTLGLPGLENQPRFILEYINFLNSIPKNDISVLIKDGEKLRTFFIEITPYVLIHLLSFYFRSSWQIEINRFKGSTSAKPLDKTVNSNKITVNELPVPQKDSVISSLSWDFEQILKKIGHLDFCVPPNTELQIQYCNNENKSELSLKHNDFNFNIIFNWSSMSFGIDRAHPVSEALMDRSIETEEKIQQLFQSIGIDCTYNVSFNFPEEEVELFNEYYNYANIIKDILENDCNYDQFLKNMPHYKIYTIDHKLNKIMKKLEKN